MKSKPIDHYDKVDLQEAMAFCDILFSCFNLKSAAEAAQSYEDELNEFCSQCEEHSENCGCNSSYRAEYDDGASYED